MNINKEDQDQLTTKYLVQFCYTCERAHACTTEETTAHCMKIKQEEAEYAQPQDEMRELLRWYEQI
ncbi:hypothetical protein HUB94_03830 [Paenibacillus cellulosilyticus]|nr:hypothetical protein HUB94_03830 [Paenibacillus cellulosilyticus]